MAVDGALWLAAHGTNPVAHDVRVFRSGDLGATWTQTTVAARTADIGAVRLAARSAGEAWLLVQRASNTNFSDGELLHTIDSGATWARLDDPPIAGDVAFASPLDGVIVGGASGRAVYETHDGGMSWTAVPGLDALWAEAVDVILGPPIAVPGGWRLVAATDDSRARSTSVVRWAAGEPASARVVQTAIRTSGGDEPVRDAVGAATRDLLASFPAAAPLRARGVVLAPTVIAAQIEAVSPTDAWILTRVGACAGAKAGCQETTTLLATVDGGATLTDITPGSTAMAGGDAAVEAAARDVALSENRGFDKCTAASVASLQTWWNDSPYRDVNIYIGGISRGCSQPLLNAAWVRDVFAQGWRLIPTWVGYQAPCTSCTTCRNRVSLDLVEAEAEGVREADRASDVATGLGLVPQTVVYLDIEAYASNDRPCRDAVGAFVNGWGRRMRERGNVAGVYGSATNASQDWTGITHRPDAVWIGKWDLRETVWGLTPLSDAEWATHQRIHQYRGGHDETWGGVTFNIDNDIEDGPVAAPAGAALPDATGPDLVIESPAPDAVLTSATFAVRGTASDVGRGDSGIGAVTVNGAAAAGGTASGGDVAAWSAEVTLPAGAQVISVEATDASAMRNVTRATVRVVVTALPAVPTVIAAGLTDPRALWIDGPDVVWIDATGVLARTPLADAAETVRIDEALDAPTALAGDAHALFVADARGIWQYRPPARRCASRACLAEASSEPASPKRCRVRPASPKPLSSEPASPKLLFAEAGDVSSLVVFGDWVFWTDRAAGQVRRLHVPTGETTVMASSIAPASLQVHGDRLVWIEAAPRGSIWSIDILGSDARRLADGTNTPGVFVSNGRVLWAQIDDQGEAGRLRAVSIAGGESTIVVDGLRRPWSVTQAGAAIYWTESLADGTVWRAALDGTAASRVATRVGEPTSITASEAAVVWIERAGGEPGRGRIVAMSAAGAPPTVFTARSAVQ